MVDNAIKELEETTGYQIYDEDERGRIEQSMEKLGKLINQGVQIYSTIDAPKETKALFEPFETQYLSFNNEVKGIEENK